MSDIRTIMTADEYGQTLVRFADQQAQNLVQRGLTRSQIRNIFTEVRKIEALWKVNPKQARRRLEMLKPKLAYQAKRHQSKGKDPVSPLARILTEAIDYVKAEDEQSFRRFVELFEAILAYHRAHGGKD